MIRTEGRAGFSLAELMVALLLFEVGILAVAGMVLTAQQELRRSALILRGTLEALRVGDSLEVVGATGGGEVEAMWGKVIWVADGSPEPGVDLWAISPDGGDTLAAFHLPPLSFSEGPPREEGPAAGVGEARSPGLGP